MRNFVNLFIKHRQASSAITVPYCSESHFSSASIGFSRFLFAAHLYIVHVLYTPQSIVAERNGNTIFVYINASSVGFCWQKRDARRNKETKRMLWKHTRTRADKRRNIGTCIACLGDTEFRSKPCAGCKKSRVKQCDYYYDIIPNENRKNTRIRRGRRSTAVRFVNKNTPSAPTGSTSSIFFIVNTMRNFFCFSDFIIIRKFR